jgi:hypothetical protein
MQFQRDFRRKGMNKETRKGLCPQITQMEADEDLGNPDSIGICSCSNQFPLSASSARDSGAVYPVVPVCNSESGCSWPRRIAIAGNQSKCLTINHLHPEMALFQSSPIKAGKGKSSYFLAFPMNRHPQRAAAERRQSAALQSFFRPPIPQLRRRESGWRRALLVLGPPKRLALYDFGWFGREQAV